MQLSRAIALIAVVLIVVLAAGYAAAEHAELLNNNWNIRGSAL